MKLEEQYLDLDGSLTVNQQYDEDGKPILEEAIDADGNYLFLLTTDEKEYYTFINIGHKLDRTDFNEETCIERAVINAIRLGLEREKNKLERSI